MEKTNSALPESVEKIIRSPQLNVWFRLGTRGSGLYGRLQVSCPKAWLGITLLIGKSIEHLGGTTP